MKTLVRRMVLLGFVIQTAHAEEWEQSFDLGATLTNGNSESILATVGYGGSMEVDRDEYKVSASYTYGEEDGDTTNNEILFNANWNRLFSEFSYFGVRADFRRDPIAEIDYRATLSGVCGHYFIKNDSTFFSVEGGPGFSFEEEGGISREYFSVYCGQKFEHKFNDKTKVFESVSLTTPVDEIEDYSILFEAGVETFLAETLALKITIQNKYEAEPVDNVESNDFKLVTGISYKF